MNVVLRRNGDAIKRSRLIAPLAQRGDNLFVDSVADRLHNSRLDDVALRVDGDFDNYIALKVAREFRAGHGWIRKRGGLSDEGLGRRRGAGLECARVILSSAGESWPSGGA